MCGIAGYSLAASSRLQRTLAAQALLAGIAERGADAVGYAYRVRPSAGPRCTSSARGRARSSSEIERAGQCATQVLVHVRDYTKGHPTIDANNHPIRHGAVVGIHNGIIFNDDELLPHHGIERAEPEMTVDSEAIFALAERAEVAPRRRSSSSTARWRPPGSTSGARALFVARGVGRPLWIGAAGEELFFASTRAALELVERDARLRLRKSELADGTVLAVAEAASVRTTASTPDRSFVEDVAPAVRAPHEGAFCLQRLAAIAACRLAPSSRDCRRGATSTPSSRAARDEVLERRPGAARASNIR